MTPEPDTRAESYSLEDVLPCGCKAVACDDGSYRIEDGWDIGCPKRHKSGDTLRRIHTLTQTITERYYYDPDEIRRVFGGDDPEKPLDDLVIETFELHDGSAYADRFFDNDANPQVGIDLVTGWDDD